MIEWRRGAEKFPLELYDDIVDLCYRIYPRLDPLETANDTIAELLDRIDREILDIPNVASSDGAAYTIIRRTLANAARRVRTLPERDYIKALDALKKGLARSAQKGDVVGLGGSGKRRLWLHKSGIPTAPPATARQVARTVSGFSIHLHSSYSRLPAELLEKLRVPAYEEDICAELLQNEDVFKRTEFIGEFHIGGSQTCPERECLLRESIDEFLETLSARERAYIEFAARTSEGSQKELSRQIDMSRPTVSRMKRVLTEKWRAAINGTEYNLDEVVHCIVAKFDGIECA